MRRLAGILAAFAVAGSPVAAFAQTHVVKKPETVVRAVGVFEWTGDEARPTASRFVPVSVFIDNQLEDAGIYMARPVPFALYTGTIFEVLKSGLPEGTIELAYERHLEGNSKAQFDDGWLGYGMFKPGSQNPVFAAKKGGPLPQVVASGGNRPKLGNKTDSGTATASADDSSRPTMRRRTDSGGSGDSGSAPVPPAASSSGADSARPTMRRHTDSDSADPSASGDSTATKASTSAASDDPDRPVLKRRTDCCDTTETAGDESAATPAASSSSAKTASSDDSDRPTMRRRSPDRTDSGGASTTDSTTDSTDDVDRPTLKKRTPTPQGKSQKRPGDTASVASAGGSLNDDPDRPTLHRGSASGGADTNGIPPLNGLPADMHQRVAVSDAKDRPEHDFVRPWDSDSERRDVLATMQEFARARLAKYDVAAPAPPSLAPAPPAPRAVAKGKKPPPPPPAPVALSDESLRGYTLSYGGSATFVYSASSPGVGGATRYVSIVAQREARGEPKVALSSVTDTTHLDRTPWMRLVDVVDAEASNRASLLFELRGESARQFALYRVIGATAEQIFQTGTTE